jgi:hypothetical protein
MFCLFALSAIYLDSFFLNIRLCKIEKNFDYYFFPIEMYSSEKLKKEVLKSSFFRRLHTLHIPAIFVPKTKVFLYFLSSGLIWCWDHFFFVRKIQ